MIYSVYNYGAHAYDYYQGPDGVATHAGTPPMRKAKSQLGASPEQVAWLLPRGARKVGSGPLPKGYIASLDGEEASSGPDLVQLGIYAVIGYCVWRAVR